MFQTTNQSSTSMRRPGIGTTNASKRNYLERTTWYQSQIHLDHSQGMPRTSSMGLSQTLKKSGCLLHCKSCYVGHYSSGTWAKVVHFAGKASGVGRLRTFKRGLQPRGQAGTPFKMMPFFISQWFWSIWRNTSRAPHHLPRHQINGK